ncbi:MAG TPA: phosphatidylglycerophosphatase A [Puia sp.]|nr:phosphatidylglycerophosphatase A [Puia sp.]
MILNLAKAIATVGGIGYIRKGSGTFASLATCILWYYFLRGKGGFNPVLIAIVFAVIALGIWSATLLEKIWGKDNGRIVIDEVAGMCVSLIALPINLRNVLLGLVLFRFLDITKPLMIRRSESLPAGWGVMADDLLAGIFTNLILQAVSKSGLW